MSALSQSPQTGQFNSYDDSVYIAVGIGPHSLNPLKRVNSILTITILFPLINIWEDKSQSPQTGQFNSYEKIKGEKNEGQYF